MPCVVIFRPGSIGIEEGKQGLQSEMKLYYPTIEEAIHAQHFPLNNGYVAEKIIDEAGRIFWAEKSGLSSRDETL